MEFIFNPRGVCARQFIFEIDGDTVTKVRIVGGCPGNLLGISSLIKGMKVDDIIDRMHGIRCGLKPTSCPDQIAKALTSYKNQL